jgi:hypothetical protein
VSKVHDIRWRRHFGYLVWIEIIKRTEQGGFAQSDGILYAEVEESLANGLFIRIISFDFLIYILQVHPLRYYINDVQFVRRMFIEKLLIQRALV